MPKNQFQRPLPVQHNHNVPRHGQPVPPVAKTIRKPAAKTPAESLPPLSALLEQAARK